MYLPARESLKYTALRTTDHIGSLGLFVNSVRRHHLTTFIVTRVLPGRPAARAGIRPGDVVVRIGTEAASVTNLSQIQGQAGTPVDVTFWRAGCVFSRHFVRERVGYDSVEA